MEKKEKEPETYWYVSEVRHCEPLAESYIDIIDVIPQETDVSSQAGRPGANALRQ